MVSGHCQQIMASVNRNGQYQRSVVSVKSAKCWDDFVSVLTAVDVFYAESGKTVKMACYE